MNNQTRIRIAGEDILTAYSKPMIRRACHVEHEE